MNPSLETPVLPPKYVQVKENEPPLGASSKPKRNVSVAQRKVGAKESSFVDNTLKIKQNNHIPETAPPKRASKKRGTSAVKNIAKSPRRSKRQKENNRLDQIAAQAAHDFMKDMPMKVTPKEDKTPKVQSYGYDARDVSSPNCNSSASSNVVRNEIAEKRAGVSAEGYDYLLGTSVAVPADDQRRDELIGFDESEVAKPDRRSLTSYLPFGGFRGRSKSKTFSRKKSRKVSTFDFDFS